MAESARVPERALLRLRQLAREERAAVASGDADALCRIAALLHPAMLSLHGVRLTDSSHLRSVLAEIHEAQIEAEAFLTARMAVVAADLQRISAGRRAARAYTPARRGAARLGGVSL